MIKQLSRRDLPQAAAVIRASFSTVAAAFGFTERDCAGHPSFMKDETLAQSFEQGMRMFGLYDGHTLAGFVGLRDKTGGVYELKHFAVLPEYRCRGYGKQLLDFCKVQAGVHKIVLDIIEENTALKNWYGKDCFVHTGTKQFAHLPFTVGYMEWE